MIKTPAGWFRIVLGLGLVFGLFQWSATILRSDRGQAGVAIALLIVAATIAVDAALFGRPGKSPLLAIGLGAPDSRGVIAAVAIGLALLLVIPLAATISGSHVTVTMSTAAVIGLFAQGGIAEEVLFRGWLFARVREGRSFWRAASVSMLPFVAVHLFLFATMPAAIALAAVLLAVVISFPLAYLYELGGGTIWPPAILHFVVQGAVKLVTLDESGVAFPIAWMLASAIVPQFVFLVNRGAPRQMIRDQSSAV